MANNKHNRKTKNAIPKKKNEKENPKIKKRLQEAVNLHKSGSLVEAAHVYAEILKKDPKNTNALSGLGTVSLQRNQLKDAENLLGQAVSLAPELYSAHNNLATTLKRLKKPEAAIPQYLKALEIKPDYHDARLNLAQTYIQSENFVDALLQAQEVIKQEARWEAYLLLGIILSNLGRWDAAEEAYIEALKMKTDSWEVYNNLAELLAERGKLRAAKQAYDTASSIAPEDQLTRWNRSLVEFRLGDLDAAYEDYDKGTIVGKRKVPDLGGRRWDGVSPLKDQLLAIQVEQGLGDELVFATCYPDIANYAKNLMITCDSRLAPAFQRLLPSAWIVPIPREQRIYQSFQLGEKFPHPDLQFPAGSLPRIFRPTIEDFDKSQPILIPEPGLKEKWRERVSKLPEGLKVGISWRSGNLTIRRSWSYFQFKELAPLLDTLGATFVNLQYDATVEELEGIQEETGNTIHYWEDLDQYEDLENLIAMIGHLDLIISVNNASSRIASALGKESWLLGKGGPFTMGQDNVPFFTNTVVWDIQDYSDRSALVQAVGHELTSRIHKGVREEED